MFDEDDDRSQPLGTGFTVRGDTRLASVRRMRALTGTFEQAMGSHLSETQRLLARRAASLQLVLEQIERDLANGHEVDLKMMIRTQRVLATLHKQMGIDVPQPVPRRSNGEAHTLESYIEANYPGGTRFDDGPAIEPLPDSIDEVELPRTKHPPSIRPRRRRRVRIQE